MKKLLSTLGFLALVAVVRPAPAAADFSLSVGLPGFGVFVHEPCPPRVFYPPPVYYQPPVVYYRPAPVFFPRHHYHYRDYRRGNRYGWYEHHRDRDDD